MLKKLLVLVALLASLPAAAQNVQYVSPVTRGHVPVWNTNGVIADGGSSADSPINSFGVTNSAGAGICDNSGRITSSGYIGLCLGFISGVPTISVQNYGTASIQPLQFVVNGTTYPFPGSLANITIGTTPVVGGTNSECLFVSGGFVGQQACTLSAITSLLGDGTATGPGASVLTLATVNSSPGTFGSGAVVPIITVNAKGLITGVSTASVGLTVGSSTIVGGTTNSVLYQNGTVLGELSVVGNAVLGTDINGVPSLSTTLPGALTIPSPTFTGTETFPDSATWTNLGISKVAALSAGSATIPSGGNINISGQYQVNGSQIAASNLSNGVTGSGAVVLAASPTLSGTVGGSFTFSGNNTFSGQGIFKGTSAPSSAAGQNYIMGTIAAPTLSNNGQGAFYNTTANGAVLQGAGSSFDVVLANKSGSAVIEIPTGTTQATLPGGLNLTGLSSGTCSAGVGINSSNQAVLIACPGATSAIQVGATNVTSGTFGAILYDNAGVLGNITVTSTAHGLAIWEGSTSIGNTGTGTAGQALYSNGSSVDPSYKSGAWTLLAVNTVSGGTLVDTTSISATYTEYEIVVENMLPVTNSVNLTLQFQVGGSFVASSYLSSVVNSNGSAVGANSSTTGVMLGDGGILNTGSGINARYLLSNPGATLTCKSILGDYSYNASGINTGTVGGCYNGGSGAITGIQIVSSSGALNSGTMKIYGRVN